MDNRETALNILHVIYADAPDAYHIVSTHSIAVADFALSLSATLPSCDQEFIERASILHDCGIILTNAPGLGCFGKAPYLTHGILGARILQKQGLLREAEVCRTHIGVGITAQQIIERRLPLPHKDCTPQTIEEKLVAYADCFYSKRAGELTKRKPFEQVLTEVSRFGDEPRRIFLSWHELFGSPSSHKN